MTRARTIGDIGSLAITDSNFIVGDGTSWVAENGGTVRTSIGLGNVTNESKATMFTSPTFTSDTTVSGNVAGALTLSVENTNVTGSSILQLNSGAGTKYVNFLATDNGDYVQEANANLPTRYADYDTHIWRNTAGTEKMRLDTSTGDFTVGNFVFDSDQTVGAGQDNYVMTYDNTSGKVSLEAASGGGVTTGKAIAMAMIFG